MSQTPKTDTPFRSVDERGRVIPMTEEEVRARNEIAIRGLEALDDMGDEEEQTRTFEALKKAIDEDPLSYRKRFR